MRRWKAPCSAGATRQFSALDAAFKAEVVLLPSESLIGDRMDRVDPDAIHQSREQLRVTIGSSLRAELLRARGVIAAGDDLSPAAKGARRLNGVALGLLAAGDPGRRAGQCSSTSSNRPTDRALDPGVARRPERQAAMEILQPFRGDRGTDKVRAAGGEQRRDTFGQVERLRSPPVHCQPHRLRAMVGRARHQGFTSVGAGLSLVAGMIIEPTLNPSVAARLVSPFGRWRRFDEQRAALMRAELERIVAVAGLSKDVYEQASKSLA